MYAWAQEFHDLLAGVEHEAQRGEEDRVNTQLEKIEFSGKAKLVGDPTFEQTFSLYVTIANEKLFEKSYYKKKSV